MGSVRKYHVTHNGHKTILKLNDTDVKLYPDAVPVDDDQTEQADTADGKSRTASNKARRPSGDKSGA